MHPGARLWCLLRMSCGCLKRLNTTTTIGGTRNPNQPPCMTFYDHARHWNAPSEVLRMRRELVHLDEFYYFNPKGKTRKSRRRVPLSNRVLPLLRARMQGDQTEDGCFLRPKLNQVILSLALCNESFGRSRGLSILRMI